MRRSARPSVLPSALTAGVLDEVLGRATPAVFLDYDGVLAEIVADPAAAVLAPGRRAVVARLAARCCVAVVSGRDLRDVRDLVGLDGLVYAGSHGFDLDLHGAPAPDLGAEAYLPALDDAERTLTRVLGPVPGAWVERKRFAVAVHLRQVAAVDRGRVEGVVDAVAARNPKLRRTTGKQVRELRPDLDWDKGRAVLWLLAALGLDRDDVVALYLGDDETDEDAFRALAERGRGVGILVGAHSGRTAAPYGLRDPDDVQAFLTALADRLDPV